jgi:iron complex outermembrane receptor protein
MGMDLDLGIRHDRVNRRGTVAHQEEEEHHDEDEDHDEDHDEHEVEAYDIDRNETSLALSLGSVINENTSFNFGLASVKRAPSAVELFMNGEHLSTGRFEVGDASLKSETSNNIDFTLDYENNGVFASATIFRNNIDDYIYLRDETEAEHEMHEEDDHEGHGGLILSNYMQKDAEFNGYEFEIGRSLNFNDGSMTFSYGMDYVNAKFKDGTYVPRINPRRHIFTLTYAKDETSASMTFRNVTSQSKLSLNETPTESYKMVDLKLSQRIPIFNSDGEMLVTLFAKNLLDEVARNHSSFVKDEVPLPGRNIGLRFNMKF